MITLVNEINADLIARLRVLPKNAQQRRGQPEMRGMPLHPLTSFFKSKQRTEGEPDLPQLAIETFAV
jgi:hypothetical protein